MAGERTDVACLWDMLDAARAVRSFVQNKNLDDYLKDRMLRGAVERHLEIIGEAARRISTEFRDAHPEIPWRGIIGQRHVLAHDYGEIRHDRLWAVATDRMPQLIAALERLVPPTPG